MTDRMKRVFRGVERLRVEPEEGRQSRDRHGATLQPPPDRTVTPDMRQPATGRGAGRGLTR